MGIRQPLAGGVLGVCLRRRRKKLWRWGEMGWDGVRWGGGCGGKPKATSPCGKTRLILVVPLFESAAAKSEDTSPAPLVASR